MKERTEPFMQRLLEHWRSKSIPYCGGVGEDELKTAEHRFGPLPDEFKAYYRATNGTEVAGSEGEDDRGFRFFKLSECYAEEAPPAIVLFATWFEGMHYLGVGTGKPLDGIPTAVGGVYLVFDAAYMIADSFEKFVEIYIADDPRLQPEGAREANGLRRLN